MPVIQPSRSDVHVDGPLSNISVAFLQAAENYVADRAFLRVPVQKKSDDFFTYDRGFWNRNEMLERAPGTESAGINYSITTDNYSARRFAIHRDIDDEVRANADSPIQLDREATELLAGQSLLKKEIDWVSDFFVTSIWTNEDTGVAGVPVGAQFQQWDQAASTPIVDVRDAVRTVQELTTFRPNKMVLQRGVYDKLLDHPAIVGRLDRGQSNGPAIVMRQNLAELFELDEIMVMDAVQNTAAEGAANAHSFIAGKNALLLYAPSSPGLYTPAAGYTFSWVGLLGGGALGSRISRFRMEHLKSDRLELEMSYDQKLVSADLGFMFLSAIA